MCFCVIYDVCLTRFLFLQRRDYISLEGIEADISSPEFRHIAGFPGCRAALLPFLADTLSCTCMTAVAAIATAMQRR